MPAIPNNEQVIERICTERRFKVYCINICKRFPSIEEDIFSETIIYIIEKKFNFDNKTDEEVSKIFISVCRNVIRNPNNQDKYNYKYNNRAKSNVIEAEFNENINIGEIEYNSLFDEYEERIKDNENDTKETFYKKNLIRLYIKYKSYRKISQLTKIPHSTICNDINSFRKI